MDFFNKKHKLIEDVKITVIGDIMLDHYVMGKVERISPEAPVPVIEVTNEEYTLGGCGNVVKNLCEIGCQVHCISRIGDDNDGKILSGLLQQNCSTHNLLVDSTYKTTRKTRMVSKDGTQLLRVDREIKTKSNNLNFNIPECDIIIVSDYNKGMITLPLMDKINESKNRFLVDPKPENSILYNGAFLVTPNIKEFDNMKKYPKVKYTLKTLGEDGMILWNHKNDKKYEIKAEKVKVYNVSGCGDTVIAIMGLCLSMNLDIKESATIANICAGLVAAKPGTATVTQNEFLEVFENVMTDEIHIVKH